MTFREALRGAMARLRESGADTPDRDARALLLWSSGLDPAALIVREREDMPETAVEAYAAAISRRMAGEPVARIIGSRAFYGRDFIVTPDVLDPRADSETLIDAALETARATGAPQAPRILDLGTGTGCLLLSLLDQLPLATGLGIDLSHEALAVARQNAERLQLNKKAEFRHSNWLEKVDETFDLVVCNPPYIGAHEGRDLPREVLDWDPALALFAEKGGLAAYECIALGLSDVLSRAGTGFFEVGYEQADAVARIFADAGFREIAFRADLSGTRRCVIVR